MPIGLCDRTAPIANVLASVVKTNGSSKLGYMKTRVVKAKKKKKFWEYLLKLNGTSFCKSFVIGLDKLEKFGINL